MLTGSSESPCSVLVRGQETGSAHVVTLGQAPVVLWLLNNPSSHSSVFLIWLLLGPPTTAVPWSMSTPQLPVVFPEGSSSLLCSLSTVEFIGVDPLPSPITTYALV